MALGPTAAGAFSSGLAPDGDVVLHQRFVDVHRGSVPPDLVGLARVGSGGEPVAGFGRNGFVVDRASEVGPAVLDVAVDGSGRTWVVSDAAVRRYAPDGASDPALDGDGAAPLTVPDFPVVDDAVALPGGGLVLGGQDASGRLALARLHEDGSVDPRFGAGGVAHVPDTVGESAAAYVRLLPDGRLLAGGDHLVARFLSDGTLDQAFGVDGVIERPFREAIAAAGDDVLAARSAGPDGITVERLDEGGRPVEAWGNGGQITMKLDARDYDKGDDGEPIGGSEIRYGVGDLLALEDGGVVVGATENRTPFDLSMVDCPSSSGAPVLLTAAGQLDRRLESSGTGGLEHLGVTGDGSLVATGSGEYVFLCGYDPGYSLFATFARYDTDLGLVARSSILPVVPPPDMTIAERPADVSGPDVRFVFTPQPTAQDQGDVVFDCSLDGALWGRCAAESRYAGLAPGQHRLEVRARGVNGAPSDVRTVEWTVVAERPPEPVPGPASTPADGGISEGANPGATALDPPPFSVPAVRLAGARRVSRSGAFDVLSVGCPSVCGRVVVEATTTVGRAAAAARLRVGRTTAVLGLGETRSLRVRLTRRGRALLRRRHGLRLRVTVAADAGSVAAGRLTLRRPVR